MAELESLSLDQYLDKSTRNKRILIVPEVSKGNTLIRMYEKKTSKIIQNVSCQTVGWLAEQINNYVQAGKGYEAEYELIDDQSALIVFRSTLINNIGSLKYYHDKEKLLSIATTQELFEKVNLLRGNECIPDERSGDGKGRISDLKTLIEKYEENLETHKKHDKTARCKCALEYLRSGGGIKSVFGANTQISYLKEGSELYDSIQKELLERISAQEVVYFTDEISEDSVLKNLSDMDKEKHNISFFKGLGSFNEANYIAYDILDTKKNYGDVLVLYNSAEQLPAIRSALSGNGISMNVVSSNSATENCIISLARSIIAWAMDDYSEKSLEAILGSPICYVPGLREAKKEEKQKPDCSEENTVVSDPSEEDVSEDNVDDSNLSDEEKEKLKTNLLRGYKYYRYVTNARRMGDDGFALGWEYKRNKDFNQHEKTYTENNKDNEDTKKYCTDSEIIEMIGKMLDIFEEIGNGKSLSMADLFGRLYEFVKEYTRPVFIKTKDESGNEKWIKADNSREIGLSLLKGLKTAMAFDNKERDAKDLLNFADEALSSASTSDSSSSDAVTVRALNSWIPIDRKHVYITGLSLNEMQVSSSQSPVISDKEMKDLLGGKNCYIPSFENRNKRQQDILAQTLATFEDGTLSFGFSYWNAEKRSPVNPHYFYIKAYETIKQAEYSFKDPEDISKDPFIYFEYGNPTAEKAVTKEDCKEKDGSVIDVFETINLSGSSLENLLSCPKKFAYSNSKVERLPDNQYRTKDPAHWLDALRKGTFFHDVMEKYSRSDMRNAVNKLTDDEKQRIRNFAEEVFKETMIKIAPPIEDKAVIDRNKDDLIKKEIILYIEDLREDMRENHWKIWEPEKKFEDLILSVDTYADSEGNSRKVTMRFHEGFLDCIDYRLVDDGTNKKVELRIRDYKTGKYDNKKDEFKNEELIQYKVYAEALKTILLDEAKIKISEAEGGKTEGWPFEFVLFRYDFPSDRDKTAKKIEICADELDNYSTRLKVILTAMLENNTYPDVLELKKFGKDLADRLKPAKLNEITSTVDCKYCAYQNLCINRKSGEI